MQKTLQKTVSLHGVGLHTGRAVHMTLHPAGADHGIVFQRTDVDGENLIPAHWDRVVNTRLCTEIANDTGVKVGTVEHLMAALCAMRIDNVLITLDAPEVPILDGSSLPFIEAIEEVGLQTQSAPRRAIKVLKEVRVEDGDKCVTLSPSMVPTYTGMIDFDHEDIGVQRYTLKLLNGNFKHDLADCRTFCFEKDVETLRAMGLALGGSLDNAVVLNDDGVINEDGLRCADEFVRHKLLDAVGDLYLAAGPVLGAYDGVRAGHDMNNRLLHALFADPDNYAMIDLYVDIDESDKAVYHRADDSVAV